MRKMISNHMRKSIESSAHAYLMTEIDMTSIVNFLKSYSYKIYNVKDISNEFNFEKNKIENVINLYAYFN